MVEHARAPIDRGAVEALGKEQNTGHRVFSHRQLLPEPREVVTTTRLPHRSPTADCWRPQGADETISTSVPQRANRAEMASYQGLLQLRRGGDRVPRGSPSRWRLVPSSVPWGHVSRISLRGPLVALPPTVILNFLGIDWPHISVPAVVKQ
jgi:hypothetical protein